MRAMILAVLYSALGGCADQGLKVYNTPPEVSFSSPVDGQLLVSGEPVALTAVVSDAQTSSSELALVWTSSLEGELAGEQTIADAGVSLLVDGLSAGDHTLTLRAMDSDGASGEDAVGVAVVNNAAPEIAFDAPTAGERILLGVPFEVRVTVSDDYSAPEQVILAWSGIDALSTAPGAAASDGTAAFTIAYLPAGTWTLQVTATDHMGGASVAYVPFTVFEDDDDRDGYADAASGGTDCDDEDEAINPAIPEDCDAVDNDCSGVIDDDGTCDCIEETHLSASYLFCREDKGWLLARDICAAQGRHLLQLDDADEDAWASATSLVIADTAVWWIGLNDLADEGIYVWDGGTTATYTNWAMYQPDDQGGGDDCVHYHITQDGGWNDLACSGDTTPYDTYFVCE